ncbi:McrB family protein [Peribacillus frigoritolerans]|uniref:McrB family protein n=1 Tax=Peribacillus frigoritolerans TaxID=450367 RepID=UPI003F84B608
MRRLTKEIIVKSFEIGRTIYASPYKKKSTIKESTAQSTFYNSEVKPKIDHVGKKSPNVLFKLCLKDLLMENNLEDYEAETFHYRGNIILPYCWAATRPPNIDKVKASPQLYILIESEIIRFGFSYGINVAPYAPEVEIVKDSIRLQRKIFKLIKGTADLDLYSSVDDHMNYSTNKITVNRVSDISSNWSNKVHIMKAVHKNDVKDDIQEIINRTLAELLPIYQFICNGKEINKMSALTEKLLKKVQANRQLIITGAPGTGKTYSAKKLGTELCDIDENDPNRDFLIDFVQFHPSFDYTDFIDGLKPEKTDAGEMIFELKNGVFKEFCRKAGVIERILYNAHIVNDDRNLFEIINSNLEEYCHASSEIEKFWAQWVVKNENYLQGHELSLFEDEITYNELVELLPQFTFIIDEINRGEISKIFGELMYCLEPGYRGLSGVISTQYAGLSTKESFYTRTVNDKFFIPSNLYLIGTMNDIDRSIDIFDFAMRRRFVWHEIKVTRNYLEESLKDMLEGTSWGENTKLQDLIARATALNEKFVDSSGPMLGHSYQLGPAYFKKISLYGNNEESYNALWENHIEPLIHEYMRGNSHYPQFIKDCEKALTAPRDSGA